MILVATVARSRTKQSYGENEGLLAGVLEGGGHTHLQRVGTGRPPWFLVHNCKPEHRLFLFPILRDSTPVRRLRVCVVLFPTFQSGG